MKWFNFWKKKISASGKKLKRKVAKIVSLSGFGSGTVLLSPNITGSAIGNLNQTSSNLIGGILIIIGIIAGFFWLRGRK